MQTCCESLRIAVSTITQRLSTISVPTTWKSTTSTRWGNLVYWKETSECLSECSSQDISVYIGVWLWWSREIYVNTVVLKNERVDVMVTYFMKLYGIGAVVFCFPLDWWMKKTRLQIWYIFKYSEFIDDLCCKTIHLFMIITNNRPFCERKRTKGKLNIFVIMVACENCESCVSVLAAIFKVFIDLDRIAFMYIMDSNLKYIGMVLYPNFIISDACTFFLFIFKLTD